MIRRGRTGWAALAVVAALSGRAAAEPTADDRAAAETLFQDALQLVREGRYDVACPKLEASNRLDPAVGTLFNLGDCYEHTGRTASAWSSFGEARKLATRLDDGRAAAAELRERALLPRLAKLLLQAGALPEGLELLQDGKALDPALVGAAVPVDPGKHTIVARAPGQEPWSTVVEVPDQPGTVTLTIPPLAPKQGGDEAAPPPEARSQVRSPLGGQQVAGIVVGSVGLAGVIVGGVFGALAAGKVGESNPYCTDEDPDRCTDPGLALRRDADSFANVSNVAFAAGSVLIVGGALVFVLAPSILAGEARDVRQSAPRPRPPSGPRALSVRVAPVVGAWNGVFLTGSY